MKIVLSVLCCAVLPLTASAQNCQSSADSKALLKALVDASRDQPVPDETFRGMLPCKPVVIPAEPLLDALKHDFTVEQKRSILESFHVEPPLRAEDVDAISRSSLSGDLIDRMAGPLEQGDVKLDSAQKLSPETISRLKEKHVSDETLAKLTTAANTATQSDALAHPPDTAVDPNDPLAAHMQHTARPVYRIGGDVSMPVISHKVEPEYSDLARAAGYSGTVLLSVVIDEQGVPRNIKVIRPLGLGLDEKAIEAVSKWRFRPATKGGAAVAVRANIEVNFRLLVKPRSAPGEPH